MGLRRNASLVLIALLAATAGARPIPPDLAPAYRTWVEEVDLLLTDEEWGAFLKLEKDYQRDGFIERFWQARDPVVATERNEFKDDWFARLDEARERFGNLADARSRILLLNGEPLQTLEEPCPDFFLPVEMWAYGELPGPLVVVFVKPSRSETFELWDPADGAFELLRESDYELWSQCSARPGSAGISHLSQKQETEYLCLLQQLRDRCPFDYEAIRAFLSRIARREHAEHQMVLRRLEARPVARDSEWLATFAAHSTDLPADAAGTPPLPARLEIFFPGRRGARTVVQGVLTVPVGEAGSIELAGLASLDFQLTGEVVRQDALFESFRYRFDLPMAQLGEEAPLAFERLLRPGTYELILKLEDLHAQRYFRQATTLEVPKLDGETPPPPAADTRTARFLEDAARALRGGEDTLRLVRPQGDTQVGMVRFDAVSHGADFARVTFYVDGKEVLSKKRPPYSVELDLGRVPRVRTVRVVGYGEDGGELARDEFEVNTGRHHFAVRLVEPQPAKRYGLSLLARAEVDVPEGARLERLELYVGETRQATLFQPPFEQTLALDGSRELTYVRAMAYLDDANTAEDVVFVNAPDYLEEVDVQLVELYASVLDAKGRPVEGLTAADFQVAEDGTDQEIRRFEQVRDLPIHAGILLDVSASMEDRLATAREAALRFFTHILTPRDRAAVVTFNDRPHLTVGFSNEVEALAREMASLRAEGGTALWDSVVFTLHAFNGITGQRAVLLLSDGEDQSSRFTFEEVLAYAQSAGVTLYAIGLDLEAFAAARGQLTRLADATGGRGFFIHDVAELAEVYARIERELRSKYLIVYQSSNSSGGDGFRRVELRVLQPGLEVRTIQGYYP